MAHEHRDKQQEEKLQAQMNSSQQTSENNSEQNEEQERSLPKNVNSGLISLEIVARMNKIDIDMRSVVREFGIETADSVSYSGYILVGEFFRFGFVSVERARHNYE